MQHSSKHPHCVRAHVCVCVCVCVFVCVCLYLYMYCMFTCVHGLEDRVIVWNVAFIYVYVIVIIFVLVQVVVAVLLDNFFRVSKEQQDQEQALEKNEQRKLDDLLTAHERYHFDFYLEHLVKHFQTDDDVHKRIRSMFNFLDVDRSLLLPQ